MSAVVFIVFAISVGLSMSLPLDVLQQTDFQYDYYNNYYQPCVGALPCRPVLPFSRFGNAISTSNLGAVANTISLGSDLTSSVAADFTYPYGYPKTVDVSKENYVRGYGFGQTEVGVRDEVTIRPGYPGAAYPSYPYLPYSRFCSYFPVSTCLSGIGRYPVLSNDYLLSR